MPRRPPTDTKLRIENRLVPHGLRAAYFETHSGTRYVAASFDVKTDGGTSRRSIRVPVVGGLVEDDQVSIAVRLAISPAAALAYSANP